MPSGASSAMAASATSSQVQEARASHVNCWCWAIFFEVIEMVAGVGLLVPVTALAADPRRPSRMRVANSPSFHFERSRHASGHLLPRPSGGRGTSNGPRGRRRRETDTLVVAGSLWERLPTRVRAHRARFAAPPRDPGRREIEAFGLCGNDGRGQHAVDHDLGGLAQRHRIVQLAS